MRVSNPISYPNPYPHPHPYPHPYPNPISYPNPYPYPNPDLIRWGFSDGTVYEGLIRYVGMRERDGEGTLYDRAGKVRRLPTFAPSYNQHASPYSPPHTTLSHLRSLRGEGAAPPLLRPLMQPPRLPSFGPSYNQRASPHSPLHTTLSHLRSLRGEGA